MSSELSPNSPIFSKLMSVILERRQKLPPNSYTTTLFLAGKEKITEKVKEECLELIEAVLKKNDKNEIIHETSDLFYHIFVLLVASEVTLNEIEQELSRRFGLSGLTEKTSRQSQP